MLRWNPPDFFHSAKSDSSPGRRTENRCATLLFTSSGESRRACCPVISSVWQAPLRLCGHSRPISQLPHAHGHYQALHLTASFCVRLLLFWSAVFPDAGSGFTALGFPDLPFTAEPSGCPFFPPERDFRDEVSFRPWDQFPKESHQFREIVTEVSFS